MKIGILTYHRSHNFGALFQGIATRTLLESQGHEVYFIDYWPKYHKAMYSLFSFWVLNHTTIGGAVCYILKCLEDVRTKRIRKKKYESFIEKYIVPWCVKSETTFDVIIYGSDQIWRKQPYINAYNPIYFGVNNYITKKHLAYAASMGVMKIDDKDREILKRYISHIDKLSVREENLLTLVHELGFKEAITCLDPAILMTAELWNKLFPLPESPKEKYALFVNYIPDSFNEQIIRKHANDAGLKFIKVNGSVLKKDTDDALTSLSPLELFNLIRNASFIYSSSFHAMVFSVIYHKQFYASFKNNSFRAFSLLDKLDLKPRLLNSQSGISENHEIDYIQVDNKLENMRKKSLDFLFTL